MLGRFSVLLLSLILSGSIAEAGKKHTQGVAPVPALKAQAVKSDLLLEILGNIYPQDQFPAECFELLKGAPCAARPFGHFHIESKKDGELVYSKTTFTAPEGDQVIEQSWEKDGHVKKAMIENRALQKNSELEVKDGKVFYKVTDMRDGSSKTSSDDWEENLVVPSTVMSYIRPSFRELGDGKEVRIKVAVLDRRESYTFTMKKIRDEKTIDGEQVMVLQMAPVSFIVKALVDPMSFYVKPRTGELYAFEGKSALRRKNGDQYQELKVRTAYEYKINTFNQVQVTKTCDSSSMIFGKDAKCEVKAQ